MARREEPKSGGGRGDVSFSTAGVRYPSRRLLRNRRAFPRQTGRCSPGGRILSNVHFRQKSRKAPPSSIQTRFGADPSATGTPYERGYAPIVSEPHRGIHVIAPGIPGDWCPSSQTIQRREPRHCLNGTGETLRHVHRTPSTRFIPPFTKPEDLVPTSENWKPSRGTIVRTRAYHGFARIKPVA